MIGLGVIGSLLSRGFLAEHTNDDDFAKPPGKRAADATTRAGSEAGAPRSLSARRVMNCTPALTSDPARRNNLS